MSAVQLEKISFMSIITVCGILAGAFAGIFSWGKVVGESQWGAKEKEFVIRLDQQSKNLEAEYKQKEEALQQQIKTLHDRLEGTSEKEFLIRLEQQSKKLEAEHKQKTEALQQQIKTLHDRLEGTSVAAVADIFVSGHFGKGLFVGLNTSKGKSDWATRLSDCIRLDYPVGQSWGTWYITVGQATDDVRKRRHMNVATYDRLSLELKGKKGDVVTVALKDSEEDGGGNESRHSIQLRSNEWESYEIDLHQFKRADLEKIYVVASFVFGSVPQTVFVRKIQFQ